MLERSTYVPALDKAAYNGGDDFLGSARERLFGFVNGQTGADNKEPQGFVHLVKDGHASEDASAGNTALIDALRNGGDLLNVFGDFPTENDPRHAAGLQPALGRPARPLDGQGRPAGAEQAPDRRGAGLQPRRHPPRPAHRRRPGHRQAAPYGSVGVDINCAVIGFIDKAADGQPRRARSELAVPAEVTAPTHQHKAAPAIRGRLPVPRGKTRRRRDAYQLKAELSAGRPAGPPPYGGSSHMVNHKTASVDGLSVFYREAGEPGAPKLLLLGGFPASSHQFRNLIPALADRFHVVALDYPGFGNTDMPDPAASTTPSTTSSEIVDGLARDDRLHRPDGHLTCRTTAARSATGSSRRHPDWLEWQVIQNANAYEEGFTAAWDGIRHALWVGPHAETEAPLLPFLSRNGEGHLHPRPPRSERRSAPTTGTWTSTSSSRPNAQDASQLDLFYDYRTNVDAVPGLAGVPARAPARDADLLGAEATSSSPRRAARPTCATCRTPSWSGSTRGTSRSRTSSGRSPRRSSASTPSGSHRRGA